VVHLHFIPTLEITSRLTLTIEALESNDTKVLEPFGVKLVKLNVSQVVRQ
jgi:hypothetical protein